MDNKRHLEFLQLNMHHCRSASYNLRRILDDACTDVAFLQEPYVHKNKVKGLETRLGTNYVGSWTVRPRACLYVSNDMNSILLQEYSDQDQVAVQVKFERNKVEHTIICCSA